MLSSGRPAGGISTWARVPTVLPAARLLRPSGGPKTGSWGGWGDGSEQLRSLVGLSGRRRAGGVRALLPEDQVPGGADGGSGTGASGDDAQMRSFASALLLAWYGSQNRSLLAAKCLVETVIEIYRSGYNLDDVKLALSFMGLEYGGQLLAPLDEDILLSWAALVMMTASAVGVPLYPEGQARAAAGGGELTGSTSQMMFGLQIFVKQALDMFLSGTNLYRLQLQQSMPAPTDLQEESKEAQGPSPAVMIMQQNTRLVIITLEVIKDAGLPTDFPLEAAPAPESAAEDTAAGSLDAPEPEAASAASISSGGSGSSSSSEPRSGGGGIAGPALPVGYIPSFLLPPTGSGGSAAVPPGARPGSVGAAAAAAAAAASGGGGDHGVGVREKRAAAVRLLVAFMGACSGWLYSAWEFVDTASDAYMLGWSADDLFTQLQDEEFAQSGGVLPVGVAGGLSPQRVSASLFATWLSLVYMTLAQMGVPFPGAGEKEGWAWVGALSYDEASGGSAVQAHGIAELVSKRLQLEAQRDFEAAGGEAAGPAAASSSPGAAAAAAGTGGEAAAAAAAAAQEGMRSKQRDGFVVLEDPELGRTSGFALLMSQQISLVQMARQRVLAAAAPAAAEGASVAA